MYNLLKIVRNILLALLISSVLGYIFIVMREKLLLKNNIVFINKESVTKKLLDRADLKEFTLSGSKVKSGDEVSIKTRQEEKIEGILIGISQKENILLLVTYEDKIEECPLKDIEGFKIISKYGYFF